MKLADLRKYSIRQQFRIHFRLQNGMGCVVNEHGVAQVPEWKGIPSFNLEQELESATDFLLESAAAPDPKKPVLPRSMKRDELAGLAIAPSAAAVADHDEE